MRKYVQTWLAMYKVNKYWKKRKKGKPHGLDKELVVSLTSYPARFPTLSLTLKNLLTQTVKPDQIILWISIDDRDKLTDDILKLQSKELRIAFCEDLMSFKKIIPTLREGTNRHIITVDDDIFYSPTLIEELVTEANKNPGKVIAQRAHKLTLNEKQLPNLYADWEYEGGGKDFLEHNFPTGVRGVFYPAGCFYQDVLQEDIFLKLCPLCDDAWLYWMVRLKGGVAICLRNNEKKVYWPNSQVNTLWRRNRLKDGNDFQIQNLIDHYGFPDA